MKKIIIAIDALEYNLIEKFDCKSLKQEFYGKTDISEFSQPRTIVLWASFLTGKNMEEEILKLGDKNMWSFQLKKQDTFLKDFNCKVIDLPDYNYDLELHENEREMMKEFFTTNNEKSEGIKQEYNKNAFEHYKKIKHEFFEALTEDYELVIGYFSIADVMGHLNFGNEMLMKMIYKDLEEVSENAKKYGEVLILSDHGMKTIGKFGDHSGYGFWSFKQNLNNPKITDFFNIVKQWMGER